ncbi:MAG: Cellulase, partial [Nocardioides sp.]|nr:Cellulase [Nocardioides sp.]
ATHAGDRAKDPRRTRGLFVDPRMPAAAEGPDYASIAGKAQALWIIPEAYPTSSVRGAVRDYTGRALGAGKTPVLTVYGIPGRDCGGQSSDGALRTAAQYRGWIRQVAKGLARQTAMVILEPDALPFFGSQATCEDKPADWLGMLRFASKSLSASGAWVYLDAGHSNWTPYDHRPALLKKAGIRYDRGFSTNVSNFRRTANEKTYAATMLRGLRKLGVTGKHYVVDTSRNGAKPADDQVLNPPWARLGKRPRLVFDGAFDGTLWVKHPGESDGEVNGGPPSGQWCDLLADRLLGAPESGSC